MEQDSSNEFLSDPHIHGLEEAFAAETGAAIDYLKAEDDFPSSNFRQERGDYTDHVSPEIQVNIETAEPIATTEIQHIPTPNQQQLNAPSNNTVEDYSSVVNQHILNQYEEGQHGSSITYCPVNAGVASFEDESCESSHSRDNTVEMPNSQISTGELIDADLNDIELDPFFTNVHVNNDEGVRDAAWAQNHGARLDSGLRNHSLSSDLISDTIILPFDLSFNIDPSDLSVNIDIEEISECHGQTKYVDDVPSRKRRASPHASVTDDISDVETAPAVSPPTSPNPSVSDTKPKTPTDNKKSRKPIDSQLNLDQTISLYDGIQKSIATTQRQERNFASLFRIFKERYGWFGDKFSDPSLFKQKVKLYCNERRKRDQLQFWKKISSCKGDENKVLAIIDREFKGKSNGHISPNYDFSPLAKYLATRTRIGERSPGIINTWDASARSCIVEPMLDIHRREGYGAFALAHQPFSSLVTLGEVEVTILTHCDCPLCQEWNIPSGLDIAETTTAWTRARIGIMRDVLKAHSAMGRYGDVADFAEQCQRIPALKYWSIDRLQNFLESIHSTTSCDLCSSMRCRKIRRRHAVEDKEEEKDYYDTDSLSNEDTFESHDIGLLSLDQLDALDKEESGVPQYLRYEDEISLSCLYKIPTLAMAMMSLNASPFVLTCDYLS